MKKAILIIIDIVISALILTSMIMISSSNIDSEYTIVLVSSSLLMVAIFYLQNLYKDIFANIFEVAVKILKSWGFLAGIIFAIIFILEMHNINTELVIIWLILTPFLIIFSRYFYQKIITHPQLTIKVLGSVYEFTKYELNRLKRRNIILEYTTTDNVNKNDIVILNDKDINIKTINLGAKYLTMKIFMEKYLRKCHIENIVDISEFNKYSNRQKLIKLFIDYILSIVLILITIPITVFSIFKIKSQSKGRIIFSQNRVGENNTVFKALKFRSMNEDSHFNPYTQKNDIRVFPYGKFMRKTRIDELPQIINVLKRQMSIIGPRAEWDILSTKYEKQIPYYHLRNLVKPGISGWAQVHYPYGENLEDTKQKLMYDLYYIKNWNLALELEIIARTFFVIIAKDGI